MKREHSQVFNSVESDKEEERMSKRERLRLHFRSFRMDEAVQKIVYEKVPISTICQETGLPYYELNLRLYEYKKDNDLIETKKASRKSDIESAKIRAIQLSLTESDDSLFSKYLQNLHRLGFSWNKTDILLSASIILNSKYNSQDNKKFLNPGKSWYQKLFQNHPDLQNIINIKPVNLDLLKTNYIEDLNNVKRRLLKLTCRTNYYIFDEMCIEMAGKSPKILSYGQRKLMIKIKNDVKIMFALANVNGTPIKPKFFQSPYEDEKNSTTKDVHQKLSYYFTTFVKECLDKCVTVPAICFYDAQLLYIDAFTIENFGSHNFFLFPLPVNNTDLKCRNEVGLLSKIKTKFEETVPKQKLMNSWSNVKRLCENVYGEMVNKSNVELCLADCKLKEFL